jgi:hypothetical protein
MAIKKFSLVISLLVVLFGVSACSGNVETHGSPDPLFSFRGTSTVANTESFFISPSCDEVAVIYNLEPTSDEDSSSFTYTIKNTEDSSLSFGNFTFYSEAEDAWLGSDGADNNHNIPAGEYKIGILSVDTVYDVSLYCTEDDLDILIFIFSCVAFVLLLVIILVIFAIKTDPHRKK